MLVKELFGGSVSASTRALANTQGIVGLVGLLLNQAGGKASDAIGRRPLLFLGPLCNILLGTVSFTQSDSKLAILICRVLRMVVTTFSNTVMVSASLADIYSGKDLAVAGSEIGATVGLAFIMAPVIESFLLKRTGSLRIPYAVLALLGALQASLGLALMPETHAVDKRIPLASALTLKAWNPFGFLSVFTKGSMALQKLSVITSFQMFMEGKNVSDMGMIWMREHLGWGVSMTRNYIVTYGALCIYSGTSITPRLLKAFSARAFTTITNLLTALTYFVRGASPTALAWLGTVPIILPGVNGNTAQALKALATDRAAAEGFGKGEFSAWSNNLRALAGSVAPVLLGNVYALSRRKSWPPGAAYFVLAVVGALLPELLLQFTKDSELEAPKPVTALPSQKQGQEGVAP